MLYTNHKQEGNETQETKKKKRLQIYIYEIKDNNRKEKNYKQKYERRVAIQCIFRCFVAVSLRLLDILFSFLFSILLGAYSWHTG